MKKITLFLFTILSMMSLAQQKTTGVIDFSSNYSGVLLLDNNTSTVTLTLSGPNDRWFALQFGSFEGGMVEGNDVVYWNNTTLVDAVHNGVGIAPSSDSSNDWVLISNQNNIPVAGRRTLVFSRAFETGDVNDYTFNFLDNTIDLAWARSSTASFTLANHNPSNRDVLVDTPLNLLGVEDFSLEASKVFPNPSQGNFTIQTKTFLNEVNIYTQTGVFVKSIEVENNNENVDFNITGLQTGIYLIELINDTQKSWKKIIVN
ncbi:T9SS type A sorting domain-containing protein [Flavobacterium piscinae]|uniref:T9SS type A sorting domain-containing protein n=1 Tax=Flavobacterium piscinae TaxID=2506424 RepID=A0A4Q1KHB5_9FLAO|nr:T9SS type A sorting domain-containing protein [Flavobacterium piscinae]MBC8884338.1 T9SS type A sorting domain-containing protein [Flavobacterium piscinae]RXR29133.1 T9SS type A sorting domain-containing protein [Flavobacterium piscinae]